jgi:hypothetical protein
MALNSRVSIDGDLSTVGAIDTIKDGSLSSVATVTALEQVNDTVTIDTIKDGSLSSVATVTALEQINDTVTVDAVNDSLSVGTITDSIAVSALNDTVAIDSVTDSVTVDGLPAVSVDSVTDSVTVDGLPAVSVDSVTDSVTVDGLPNVTVDNRVDTNKAFAQGGSGDKDGSAYPYSVNPAETIGELAFPVVGAEIAATITTTGGATFTVPVASPTVMDSWAIDSVSIEDPNNNAARVAWWWAGE